jgi:Hypothetical protein (DUF2513)
MPSIDPGLQTKILQELEEADPNEKILSLDGYSAEAFCYNARQLHRMGLIDIEDRAILGDRHACWATGLTPEGHRVLKQARDEWQRKAKAAGGRAVQITVETVLRGMLEHLMR